MDRIFDVCVQCLRVFAALTSTTYKEINVIVFCYLLPCVILYLILVNWKSYSILKLCQPSEVLQSFLTWRRKVAYGLLLFLVLIVFLSFLFKHIGSKQPSSTSLSLDEALNAALMYKLKHKTHPQSMRDVMKAGILKNVPVDQWGNEIQFLLNNEEITVYSFGKNGIDEKGKETSDDILWSDSIRREMR